MTPSSKTSSASSTPVSPSCTASTKHDLAVVYETFSETVDYSDRHAAVLVHFREFAV